MLSRGSHDQESVDGALTFACQGGRTETVAFLLDVARERGYDLPLLYPLGVALELGNSETAEIMYKAYLESGGSAYKVELLWAAVHGGCSDFALKMLSLQASDINSTHHNRSMLSYASDVGLIRALLDAKADVHPEGCKTVLTASCCNLRPDAVKLLLDAQANANGSGVSFSPLLLTVLATCTDEQVDDKISVINVLLDAGADAYVMFGGTSALDVCINGDKNISKIATAQALLQRCPDLLEFPDDQGEPPLAVATRRRDTEMVKLLLDAGADVTVRDSNYNPLLFVLFSTHDYSWQNDGFPRRMTEILPLLLSSGLDPTECDDDDRTVLMSLVSVALAKYLVNDWASSRLLNDLLSFMATRP
jgi:ankyrin repeat protein